MKFVQITFKMSVYTQLNIFQYLITYIKIKKEAPHKDVCVESGGYF